MSLSVDFSKWHVRRGIGELSRIYHFSGLQVPGATATLRLDCRLESSVRGFIYSNLSSRFFTALSTRRVKVVEGMNSIPCLVVYNIAQ